MKWIKDVLTEGLDETDQRLSLREQLWPEAFGITITPKCTVADIVEHYEAYKKHVEQIYLMAVWLTCHGGKHLMTYDPNYTDDWSFKRFFAESLRQILYHEKAINRHIDAFLDICKKAGQT